MPNILLTGGAGYIGSHLIQSLQHTDHQFVVLDNLSTGFQESLNGVTSVIGDIADRSLVKDVLNKHQIDSIIHLAASSDAIESMNNPTLYYRNNMNGTLQLLQSAVDAGVNNFILSSSAAVYGEVSESQVGEQYPCRPINPYGRSKWYAECILQDFADAFDINYIILRYFNVAGAAMDSSNGDRRSDSMALMNVIARAALGLQKEMEIFGTDFATPDGSAIRDYIHVVDLAEAHIAALSYLYDGAMSAVFNVGYGVGHSVWDVIRVAEQLTNHPIKVNQVAPKQGSPAAVVANVDSIKQLLDWQPKYNDLQQIVQSALQWMRRYQA